MCGVLGGPAHWSSLHGQIHPTERTALRAERAHMVSLLNRIARTRGARLSDWHGSAYVIAGATGAQEVVESLPLVWSALDRLNGSPIDPLTQEWADPLEAGESR